MPENERVRRRTALASAAIALRANCQKLLWQIEVQGVEVAVAYILQQEYFVVRCDAEGYTVHSRQEEIRVFQQRFRVMSLGVPALDASVSPRSAEIERIEVNRFSAAGASTR